MSGSCMNKFRIEKQVIIVTGAAGLLGEMHARAILDAGGIPVMLDIDEKRVQSLQSKLVEDYKNYDMLFEVVDITNETALLKIKKKIVSKFKRIDGLINNACNNPSMKDSNMDGRFETFSHEEWSRDIEVGLYGAVCCCKVFGKYMAEMGHGVIVNIASDLAIVAPNQSLYLKDNLSEEHQPKKPVTYSAVKWGLIGLTKYLSTYWPEKGVRVNAVALGGVYNNQSEEFLQRITSLIPMGRMAKKDEYMCTIIYLLSEASSYMTGSVVTVDGGRTAW